MIDKNILDRVSKLEQRVSLFDYDIDEYIAQTINELEICLGYSINERINFSTLDYTNRDSLEKDIMSCLRVEELRKLVYGI